MFRWFENRLDAFPPEEPQEPPRTFLAFCLHYTRGSWRYLVPSTILMAAIAITEVWMFSFLGDIVNWLSGRERATFRLARNETRRLCLSGTTYGN